MLQFPPLKILLIKMFQEQQSTSQLDPIFTATSALPPPPVLVPALMSGSTSEVDTTAGPSSSLDVSAEAATTSPSSLCVAKKRGARGLLKKSESKAEKKARYQRNQNLQKRLNRMLAKARMIYRATRGVRRFMLYKLLDAVDEMIEKNRFLLGKEGNLISVSYLFSYELVLEGKVLDFGDLSQEPFLSKKMPSLFQFLADKNLFPEGLAIPPPEDIKEMYGKWIKNESNEVSFTGVIPPFLALFLSCTDEYEDETFFLFEQDDKEDIVVEDLLVRRKKQIEEDQLEENP